ncbi:Pollen Ole e 1 allergen and extensin family protein [Hirschfeldia incana]|nr:Pollen Ole e 1 allergen and extensin family protein [Hirschfeldia incana]
MENKLIMFIFVLLQLLLVVNSLFLKHSLAKPNAEVTVMGFVYCDVCSNNTFSTHSYFMSGVEVRIVCRFKSASSRTNEMMTFSANRTTNEFGLYKIAITSLDCADVDNLASSCQASLVGRGRSSSDRSCNVPGYRTTTDQVVFKSKRSNLCIYGFNALNFRPFKRDLSLCGKK